MSVLHLGKPFIMLRFFFLAACLVFFENAVAQESWQRLYKGGLQCQKIFQLSNGNFILLGTSTDEYPFVVCINPGGDTLWGKTVQIKLLGSTADHGSFVDAAQTIAGSNFYLLANCTDSATSVTYNALLWMTTTGDISYTTTYLNSLSNDKQIHSTCLASIGQSIFICNYSHYSNTSEDKLCIQKIQSNGGMTLQGRSNNSNFSYPLSFQPTPDGNLMLCSIFYDKSLVLTKFDTNLNTIWSKGYDFDYQGSFGTVTPDNGYLAFSNTTNLLIRFNDTGEIVFTKKLTSDYTPAIFEPNIIINTFDSGFILGYKSGGYFSLIKLNSNLTPQWSKTYGNSHVYAYGFSAMCQSSDSGIIFGGSQYYFTGNPDLTANRFTAIKIKGDGSANCNYLPAIVQFTDTSIAQSSDYPINIEQDTIYINTTYPTAFSNGAPVDICEPAEITQTVSRTLHFTIAPNPATSAASVAFFLETQGEVSMIITNPSGQVLFRKTMEHSAGVHHETVDVSNFKIGVYFITLSSNGITESKKLIVE